MSDFVKIRLLQSISGAEMHPAGSVIVTTIKEATGLISAGFAELVEEMETAQSKQVERRQTTSRRRKNTKK